jgi:hypothetical protein
MTGRVAPWVVSYTWWQKVILLAWERSQCLCRLTPLKGGPCVVAVCCVKSSLSE